MDNDKVFEFMEMPNAFFADNKNANNLRKQLIKNSIKVSENNLTKLDELFFSKENIELINKQIIMSVYKKSDKKFKICNQSESSLMIVMSYIYNEYAKHLPYDIKEQIRELNCKVTKEVVPLIITNVDQHIGYIKDISTPRLGPPLPVNVNHIDRTLPTYNTFMK